MLATWQEVVAAAPVAFVAGLLIGFLIGARYRIVKRNGDDK
jgi:hypothetical protein